MPVQPCECTRRCNDDPTPPTSRAEGQRRGNDGLPSLRPAAAMRNSRGACGKIGTRQGLGTSVDYALDSHIAMEPVFTLPFSEYAVAQQLHRLFPPSSGYSLFAPLSRQEKGVDLVITRRRRRTTRAASIQVKASRTYSRRVVTERSGRFRYDTWFNNFELPGEADFVALVALYPPDETRNSRRRGSWWAPVVLLFTHAEMRRFLRRVRTVTGTRDRMFGFGFTEANEIFQTRGDQHRRRRDFSQHLLDRQVPVLRRFLAGRRAGRISAAAF